MNNTDFKIGDSVYCKMDLIQFHEDCPLYKKDEEYKIVDIKNRLPFTDIHSGSFICFDIDGDIDTKITFWSVVDNGYNSNAIKDYCYLFEDYFLSLKEYRILKLNNLNNV